MRVQNTMRSRVFLMNFEAFGTVAKQCLDCLIYILNQRLKQGETEEKNFLKLLLRSDIQLPQ